VKRTAILAVSVVALASAIYAGRTWGQGTRPATTPAAAQPRTRVALLNLLHVIRKYKKFDTFQEDLKAFIKPYQAEEAKAKADAERWDKERKDPKTTQQRRDQIEKDLVNLQRKMDDLKQEFQKNLAKKQEQQMVILFGDVRTVAERIAQAHNFDLVLHYNDAVDARDYWSGPNLARKMQAGALMPLYYANGMEISQQVIDALNAAYKAPAAAPAGRARHD
jgi:Skp family chaperone for outer membrane proteins